MNKKHLSTTTSSGNESVSKDPGIIDCAQSDPVAGKTVAEILGEIVWLMTQDQSAKELPVKDIERLVMPALMLRQFHIQYAEQLSAAPVDQNGHEIGGSGKASKQLQPVSVEIFAMCSEAVSKALDSDPNIELSLQDWRSGSLRRVMSKFSISQASKSDGEQKA